MSELTFWFVLVPLIACGIGAWAFAIWQMAADVWEGE
jgi:hypothetical protein